MGQNAVFGIMRDVMRMVVGQCGKCGSALTADHRCWHDGPSIVEETKEILRNELKKSRSKKDDSATDPA